MHSRWASRKKPTVTWTAAFDLAAADADLLFEWQRDVYAAGGRWYVDENFCSSFLMQFLREDEIILTTR